MALRLIETIISKDSAGELAQLENKDQLLNISEEPLAEDRVLVRILLHSEQTEKVLDFLENRFGHSPGFRTILFPVEATLPRPVEKKEAGSEEKPEAETTPERISRQELYDDISGAAKLSNVYLAGVVLSTLVASVGLLRDDVAVIIGAMVIAPLLGPNVSLALGTTLGDVPLMSRSLKVNVVGVCIAFTLAVVLGAMLAVDETVFAISSRTQVGIGDVILALAAGSAGALAFTTGVPAVLIGVMVAVALLPPLVVAGLLLGAGSYGLAFRASLLVMTNIICVNLAGVATFLAQGIRPRRWWDADRAKRSARLAVALWAGLLGLLVWLIYVSG